MVPARQEVSEKRDSGSTGLKGRIPRKNSSTGSEVVPPSSVAKRSATECHQIMCTALGTNISSYDTVKVWYRKLKKKDYGIQEAKHSGQPTDVDDARTCRRSVQQFGSLLRSYALVPWP
ncbi:hypothetical protein X975_20003, partial [Stegodyphus mimosarum]